jgi:hypothetical protein
MKSSAPCFKALLIFFCLGALTAFDADAGLRSGGRGPQTGRAASFVQSLRAMKGRFLAGAKELAAQRPSLLQAKAVVASASRREELTVAEGVGQKHDHAPEE